MKEPTTETGRTVLEAWKNGYKISVADKRTYVIEIEAQARAFLDADDCDSILNALGLIPTWFPETAAKVERLRASLRGETPPTDT